ncbi:TPA: hypothetical protein ACGO1T_001036 [Streptococcus suis]
MKYWVNESHLEGVSIDDKSHGCGRCEMCGDCDDSHNFDTLEEACLYVLVEYGKDTLKNCGYEIANIEFREITESEVD